MNQKKIVSTGALCEAHDGILTVELMKQENSGNFLALFCGPWLPEKLQEICEFARKNHMIIQMDEIISRMSGKVKDDYLQYIREYARIMQEYADVIDCTGMLHEYGGVRFYWPESSISRGKTKPGSADNFNQAADEVREVLLAAIRELRSYGISASLKSVEARGLAVPHYLRCGIDKMDVEMTYQKDTELLYSGIAGAVRSFGKDSFGVDLATLWYGGNVHDELWFKRWRTSLYHAFIRGADPIYAEHGFTGYEKVLGNSAAINDPMVVRFRKELSDFTAFAQNHPRPAGLPEAEIAVMQGFLDGYCGSDQTHLWGIRSDDRFKVGEAETSWELFNEFYRRSEWHNKELAGDRDFSGNPPAGQVHIIPYDIPDELLQRYKAVIFLGRNVMSDELYNKLVRYVTNGGQLLLTAAHLNTQTTPDGGYIPYNNGDWQELCGVKTASGKTYRPFGVKFKAMPQSCWVFPLWTSICDPKYPGFSFDAADLIPVNADVLAVNSDRFNDQDHQLKADGGTTATAAKGDDAELRAWENLTSGVIFGNRCGKGEVILVNSLNYPGATGLKELYTFLMKAACNANYSYPAVESSDRVRYAVYPGSPRILYLLNTEENLEQCAIVHFSGEKRRSVRLAPGELAEIEL